MSLQNLSLNIFSDNSTSAFEREGFQSGNLEGRKVTDNSKCSQKLDICELNEIPSPSVVPIKTPESSAVIVDRDNVVEKGSLSPIWGNISKYRVPCGAKHDQLMELEKIIDEIPHFFGFSDAQIRSLFSKQTLQLWNELQSNQKENPIFSFDNHGALLERLQKSIENDILSSQLPFEAWQREAFNDFKDTQTTLIVRSSSNEDGKVVNAGGNETINGVEPTEENLKIALAKVVSSYFSFKSFKNRNAFDENPFQELPLCSVLIMEQITENLHEGLPIVSGVLMTNEPGWSAPAEDAIIHIAAAWGFANGTNNKTVCDEWAITGDHHYSTIRRKLYRTVSADLGAETKTPNAEALRNAPSLSNAQLMRLQGIAKKLEGAFGEPMNVEFVFKGDNLYIVQARPIQASPLSHDTNYLDPASIPLTVKKFQGEMIITGSNQVVALETSQIVYAKDLEEAERLFQPGRTQAVIVSTYESSTTHPAVNFASYRPSPIPCLVLPYDQWQECKNMGDQMSYLLCTQSGSLVERHSMLSVKNGLFIHPARFLLSLSGDENTMQEKSGHVSLDQLRNLLSTTPELLSGNLKEIQNTLDRIFNELATRSAMKTKKLAAVAAQLQRFSEIIMEKMREAADKNQMTQLAFHAGMLRQLVGQSGKDVLGAHSISGLEVATNLPAHIETFIDSHSDNQLLCELALFGLNGFDQPIQRKWVAFLDANSQSILLDKLHQELELQITLGVATRWLSENFSAHTPPAIETLVSEIEIQNRVNLGLADLTTEIEELFHLLKQIHSPQELEALWKKLADCSTQFITYCATHKCRHPLLINLIDLWDLSTKAVKTLQLYEMEEEEKRFAERVDAFSQFVIAVSRANLLEYPLEKFICYDMKSWGKSQNKFSVQHWLIPVSTGALAKITTDDQRLTVLHQNLLQAASHANVECLPAQLSIAYEHLKNKSLGIGKTAENSQVHISIDNTQASIRINIPLNYHSTVVILTQKKGCDEIEVVVYMRGNDNDRGQHLGFFEIFAKMAGIPLIDQLHFQTDLKVVFTVKDENKMELLGNAITAVNDMTLSDDTHLNILKELFVGENSNESEIMEEIGCSLWNALRTRKTMPRGFGDSGGLLILEFLKKSDQLKEIADQILHTPHEWQCKAFSDVAHAILKKGACSDAEAKFVAGWALISQTITSYWKRKLTTILKNPAQKELFNETQYNALMAILK